MFLQRKVSRRYHGSHCDSRINFNAPPPTQMTACHSLFLPAFLFLSFISSFFRESLSTRRYPPHSPLPTPQSRQGDIEQKHVHVVV